jgi:transketolase
MILNTLYEEQMNSLENMSIEDKCVNSIRALSMDGVQAANSGHPGTPMAMAPLAYVLWNKFLKYNPQNPKWFDRDRFVLSNGHASMLQYSMLHLTGYDVSLNDLQNFRQLGSITAGHPEYNLCPGVETTTGPLGQGLATAVGMAIAEAHLGAIYNKNGFNIVDHHTFVFCGDGDLMEGVSHESASLAGHLGLGKLIVLYDDNHITIEGKTDLSYSDNAGKRFESYGWNVINVGDAANDLQKISKAIKDSKAASDKPSLIIVRTHIGFGSPNLVDTSEVHGAPLGEEEIKLTKRSYGFPEDKKFFVPDGVMEHMAQGGEKGKAAETVWDEKIANYKKANPDLAAQFESALNGELPKDWESVMPTFDVEKPQATRSVSGTVLNAIADNVPYLVGGSADLNPSTKTFLKSSGYFAKGAYENKNMAWGVREFAMSAGVSGLTLHGGLRGFASTFYVFTDYARPAIRLAAIMKIPTLYIMTHDSIGVGEDGPTHQPVEQLASVRIIPNLTVFRPADANETVWAYKTAMQKTDGPSMLVLTRQNLPVLDQSKYGSAEGVSKGAYVLSKEKGDKAQGILLATGSEVALALETQQQLAKDGVDVRVVSMPSWELFRAQSAEYKEEVLPSNVSARLAIEAASPMGWKEWVGDKGDIHAIDTFGQSGPANEVFAHFGFTVENVVSKLKALL